VSSPSQHTPGRFDGAPSQPRGEISGWPKLVITYTTEPERSAPLLPPGFAPGDPMVSISVYCVPVLGEPEYGISVKVPAAFEGALGWYTFAIGIDQEAAIFSSRDTNGQPKFPCSVRYFRLGNHVHASALHQGTTFASYDGAVVGHDDSPHEFDDVEWWTKSSRAVGTNTQSSPAYDFEPHVVAVRSSGVRVRAESLEGTLELRPSAWDPVAQLLPAVSEPTAELVHNQHRSRTISIAGRLDGKEFWPFTDTIGASRWPRWAV
jgi:acetoacetate decarboxylase